MALPESKFPTVQDLRDVLSKLVDQGLGEHPVQVVVVPDSTIQAIARVTGGSDYNDTRPALMIEMTGTVETGRLPVSLISTDRWSKDGMPSLRSQ